MNNVMDKYKDYLNSDYSQAYEGDNVGKTSNVKKTENLEKILASREKIRKRSCETVTLALPLYRVMM
jgi:enolase